MKHAYLIIAHNEYAILEHLVRLLDDSRNDIYIHFDKKSKHLPLLKTEKSNLYIVDKRYDVRWGDFSQIKTEMLLMEESNKRGPYSYYHVISGQHFPLQSQDQIHEFFTHNKGTEFFVSMNFSPLELQNKGNRFNLFMRYFTLNVFFQYCWRICLEIQVKWKIFRNKDRKFIKASNWVSITQPAVTYLLSKKKNILQRYRFSMCADELFIPTELHYSKKQWNIVFSDQLLYHKIGNANSEILTIDDFEDLKFSKCLFARKFSEKNMDLINEVENNLILS
ncbi:beta-1,6-N-acetylglucosaminyltransferase [Sphingobacterium sp. HJSM2_6]|uniref:beta-1,6-N-acetylglucosaminyltransferase n=1 Tax=Sphingobacterium sp. HJSM2_6 TaxID=3366264 RepID=UPI003BE6E563